MANTAENNSQFAPGVYLKKQSFGKGKGEIIKMNISWEDFLAWAQENVNNRGYLNLDIKTAKADSSKLYVELNTWEPPQENATEEGPEDVEDEDDAPF